MADNVNKLIQDTKQAINNETISCVYNKLEAEEMWFTTKQDPTFTEPSGYYNLDEYGYLTEKGVSQVCKDVHRYIGDGAVDICGAVDLWLQDSLAECKVDYKTNLVTQFKPKQVVDQINAFKANLTESFSDAEVNNIVTTIKQVVTSHLTKDGPFSFGVTPVLTKDIKDTILTLKYTLLDSNPNLSLLLDVVDDIKVDLTEQLTRGTSRIDRIDAYLDRDSLNVLYIIIQVFEGKSPVEVEGNSEILESKKQESEFANEDLLNGDIDIIFENKEIVKEAKLVKDIEKFGEETEYIDKKGNTLNVGDLIYLPHKGYHLLRYSDNGGYYLYRPSLGFRQGPTTSKNGELIYKYNEIADKPLSNPYLEENKLTKNTTNKKIKTCNIKTESVKSRLNEENTQSSKLITDIMQSQDFDAESNQGKIVLRTSKLFTTLSSAGYDVQVSIDNGESQCNIILGNTGGSILIRITNNGDKLTPYSNGNYELTDDVIELLDKIVNIVKSI